MHRYIRLLLAALALPFLLAGCSSNTERYGVYRYEPTPGKYWELELKPDNECLVSSIVKQQYWEQEATYIIEGNKVIITTNHFGEMVNSTAHFESKVLVLDDCHRIFDITAARMTKQ